MKQKMTKEQIEKKKKRIIKIFVSIIAIIIIGIIAYNVNNYIILDKNKNINLVINNKNVTSNLKKDILIDGDNIYLSKQDLGNFFDKYIYEDTENNNIVTTYNNKIASISLSKNKISINGSNKNTYAHAENKDGKQMTVFEKISTGKSEEEIITNKMVINQLISELKDRDKEIILLRFFKEKTQTEVAKILGISQVQVSRIERKILNEMKTKLTSA